MRVLVAGATSVIGRQVVPLLQAVGHEVVELMRPGSQGGRRGPGVAVADALDAAGVRAAVSRAAPDAVVDVMTAIPRAVDPRHLARDMAMTNRLRTEGLANLVAAGAGGATRGREPGLRLPADRRPAGRRGPAAVDRRAPQFRPVVAALVEHERLAREAGFVAGLHRRFTFDDVRLVEANGLPAAFLRIGGQRELLAIEAQGGRIRAIYGVLNPDKLRYALDQLAAAD